MEATYPNVVATRDGGYLCWDTTISARGIQRELEGNTLYYDPDHQRGVKPGTEKSKSGAKLMIKQEKIDRWAEELINDTAIFGQLTWNFRPEDVTSIKFVPDLDDPRRGKLVVEDGKATIPDSYHRHMSVAAAAQSAAKGTDFDLDRRFSLRIWSVPEEFEDKIFNAMNTEHDKADATRSKWLHQRTSGQKLAAQLVHDVPGLGADNVQTVTNTVSVRDHRLAAFNTFSSACEEAWGDLKASDLDSAAAWLVKFWAELTAVIPTLGLLPHTERDAERKGDLALRSSAMGIHGYIRLARKLYPDGDLAVLKSLPGMTADGIHDFFSLDNPVYAERGIVVPGSGRNLGKKVVRSSHASRRSIGEVFAERCGLA